MKKNSLLLISIFIVTNVSAQSYKWSVYPTLGIDMGGAIPLPLSDIPKGAGGTPKLNPALGLGFEYPFASSLSISVEPTFRYYLNSIYNNDSYNVRPYSFGIMTGVSYSF